MAAAANVAILGDLSGKERRLRELIAAAGPTLVAYSGGVDSGYLAWISHEVLGGSMLALIADSASLARRDLRDGLAFAERRRIPCEVISTEEIDRPEYRRNHADRCFFCKDELFRRMEQEMARRREFRALSYGLNRDDQFDLRPGRQAAAAHHVLAPLAAADLGKEEIRALARSAGLEVWDRPASPCLASRVRYGIEVTPSVLAKVEAGEEALRALGFRVFRARYHGDLVRIEVALEELPRALAPEMAARLAAAFKPLGFRYVTLDLEGFRSGSLNAVPGSPTPASPTSG